MALTFLRNSTHNSAVCILSLAVSRFLPMDSDTGSRLQNARTTRRPKRPRRSVALIERHHRRHVKGTAFICHLGVCRVWGGTFEHQFGEHQARGKLVGIECRTCCCPPRLHGSSRWSIENSLRIVVSSNPNAGEQCAVLQCVRVGAGVGVVFTLKILVCVLYNPTLDAVD